MSSTGYWVGGAGGNVPCLDAWERNRTPGCACKYCEDRACSYTGKLIPARWVAMKSNSGWVSVDFSLNPLTAAEQKCQLARLPKPTPPGGCHCAKCNNPNPWAAPNKPDGSYICYSCR